MINFIVSQCKDIFFTFFQKKHIINKVLEINKKIHKNKNSNKKKNIILVEFSNLHSSFLPFSLFSKILSDKFDSRIFAYDAFIFHSKLSQIKFFFKKILFLHIYKIYKSFGVEKFINIDSKLFKNAQIKKKILKNVNKIKNNSDLINFKIDNIYIGDLIYDTYLKKFSKETINIKSHEFRSFFKVCLKDYFFWKNFFIQNRVRSLIVSHTIYMSALPLRIAISKNIPTYMVSLTHVYSLTKKNIYAYNEFKYFKKMFKGLKNKRMKLLIAKKQLEKRFKGEIGVDMIYSSKSAYLGYDAKKRVIKKSKNIKIIIAPHCFFDSPHGLGKNLHEDFYIWLENLAKISKKTNYDWYIKTHPDYIPKNLEIIKKFVEKNTKFILLNPNTSHNQIIAENINFALTIYGTIGVEYAAKNLPVINASLNNPHINYSFNINPKTKLDYENKLMNLKNIKKRFNNNDIYEYYYMKNIFSEKSVFIKDYHKLVNQLGGGTDGYKAMNTSKVYNFILDEFKNKKLINKKSMIINFINTREYKLGFKIYEI